MPRKTKTKNPLPVSVYVSAPLTKYPWGTLDAPMEKLAQKHRGENTGGGTGFGNRDQDFAFPNRESAEAFVKELDAQCKGLEHVIMDPDDAQ